jgi:PepSY-associated TM region
MRKNIYKWHRIISLIIAVPVLLWAASGFMHPIMTTIRPDVATQFLQPVVIDSSRISVSLQQALEKNNITQFHNFRLVHIDTNWFYQVQPSVKDLPVYLSTRNGKALNNGDRLYAQYIAKLFLEGQHRQDTAVTAPATDDVRQTVAEEAVTAHDCCDAATACVLKNEKGSAVKAVTLLTAFDDEYKFVNRLLPVYKVNFDRRDGIRIYVETTSDRFGYAVDNRRAVFDTLFALFHNWSFLDKLGKAKYPLMALLLALAFLSTLMGLYIFVITKTKKPNGNAVTAARRNHRWTSVVISLFTLMFTFSGAFHALEKMKTDDRYDFYSRQQIDASVVNLQLDSLKAVIKKPITNISAVQINNTLYWQVFTQTDWKKKTAVTRKDLMKDKQVPPPNGTYVKAADYSILPDGEKEYAQYLAGLFSGHIKNEVISTTAITKFEGEYGFVNKRLPVWKVGYASSSNERYYIETATGKLAVRVDDKDLYEGYSFSFLHKHHFMDFAGKSWRDFSTMFWAMAQIAVVTIGLTLYFKIRKNKKNNEKYS